MTASDRVLSTYLDVGRTYKDEILAALTGGPATFTVAGLDMVPNERSDGYKVQITTTTGNIFSAGSSYNGFRKVMY